MINVLIIGLPFMFFMLSSLYFNYKKLDESLSRMFLISFSEGLFAYLLTLLIVFEGYFNSFALQTGIVFALLVSGFFVFYLQKSLDQDWDLQIETIKNTLVVFFMTFVPFMVGLTMFRFLSLFLQFGFTILFTIGIFLLGSAIKTYIIPTYQSLFDTLRRESIKVYVFLWILIVALLFSWMYISIPYDTVSKPLNLSDSTESFSSGGFDSTMENSLYTEESIELSLNTLPYTEDDFVDYIRNGDYIYLLRQDGKLFVIDISNSLISYTTTLTNQPIPNASKKAEIFFKAEDSVYALLEDGVHQIKPTSTNTIQSMDHKDSELLNTSEGSRILSKDSSGLYRLLSIENESVITDRLFEDLDNGETLTVISDTLFINDGMHFTHIDNTSNRFEIKEGVPSYLPNQNTMVYVKSGEDETFSIRGTRYEALRSDGTLLESSFTKAYNSQGLVVDDTLHLIPGISQELGRIEALKRPFEFEGIHNHYKNKRLWNPNGFTDSYVITYRAHEHQLEYLQIDQKSGEALFTLTTVENKDLAMPLPFYSHYGLGIFAPMLIVMFIPITNYRKHITFIDFKSAIKKS